MNDIPEIGPSEIGPPGIGLPEISPSEIGKAAKPVLKSTTKARRTDPYPAYRFRVKWDGRYVAGISKVSALKSTTEVIDYRMGGDPANIRKLPGRTRYEPIILERGITRDKAFEDWVKQVQRAGVGIGAGAGIGMGPLNNPAAQPFRKDVVLELRDEAGHLVAAYKIHRCWVSEYQALPDLDAGGNAIAIEQIKLEHEGFERDDSVAEPFGGGHP